MAPAECKYMSFFLYAPYQFKSDIFVVSKHNDVFFRNTKVTVFGTSNFFVDIELRKCTKYQIFKIIVKID